MNKAAVGVPGRRATLRNHSPSELLSCIRALAGSLRNVAGCPRQHVIALINGAMAAASPREVAVVLGAAAELGIYPDTASLDRCHDLVQCTDEVAVRAVVWVVRHRLARQRSHGRGSQQARTRNTSQ
ncbi:MULTISPECIES: hypothetical protein [Cupriavidus]|jgi:hypothetical protein|uniref:hypothetical protein n=1 Tax=Cupriavidus sp. DF5525 TaxID=3160989 RepID=UPI0032DEBE3A